MDRRTIGGPRSLHQRTQRGDVSRHAIDHRRRGSVQGGRRLSAQQRLKTLRETCLKVFEQAEVLVVPTIPTLPKSADVAADSILWSRRLGTYTNFANLVGLCGAWRSLSAFTAGGLPTGITLLGPSGSERRLCEIGMAWQRQLDLPLGATGNRLPAVSAEFRQSVPPPAEGYVRVSVRALCKASPSTLRSRSQGARFVRACRTAPKYRFYAFLELDPPRPGLLATDEQGARSLSRFTTCPSRDSVGLSPQSLPRWRSEPLSSRTAKRSRVFYAVIRRQRRHITEFGGWIAFRSHSRNSSPQTPISR